MYLRILRYRFSIDSHPMIFYSPKMAGYYIYLLECSNGSYYTGYTTDLARRYQEHLSGSAKCKYTRSFPPRRIAAYWHFETDLSQILKIEAAIKKLSKFQKHRLIKYFQGNAIAV